MEIAKTKDGSELTVSLTGRLDTTTSPELEASLKDGLGGIDSLVIDLSNLDYISSAGLRVLLALQKTMSKQGKMVVKHVPEAVMDVFDMTGFTSILTIE